MNKIVFALFLSATLSLSQQQYLLHINKEGTQEAIPLQKDETALQAIYRLEKGKAQFTALSKPAGMTDTIKYLTDARLGTSFSFPHQNVMFQWYKPAAWGNVKAFYWRNNDQQGANKKATVRAWYANPRLETLTATKWMGYYKDPTDGDGLIQPFKPISGDTLFYTGLHGADSATYGFDPTGTEAAWLPGGQQFTLTTSAWQGVTLADSGHPMPFAYGQLFGFSLSNDDPPGTPDATISMTLRAGSSPGAPFHSLKYYESGRNTTSDGGWWLRTDYEWGMYVVVEYTEGPRTRFFLNPLQSTLKTGPRTFTATILGENAGGTSSIKNAFLKYRFTSSGGPTPANYDSVAMTATGDVYTGNIPGASAGTTVSYYITATDVNGLRAQSTTLSYRIFAQTSPFLLLYNNAQYSLANADLIYTSSSPASMKFDRWSTRSDGVTELGSLLALYQNVLVADGSFPAQDVYPALKTWLAAGTSAKKANLFFSSQDYGCFVQAACADTGFAAGTLEHDYFGVDSIGPQDVPPTTRPYRLVPQADPVTNYLVKWASDSGSTLWHFPTYELGFSGYPDAIVPKAGAVALFKNAAGTRVHGVKNAGSTFNVVYLAFDAGSLEFRSDTALAPRSDPKYWWIVDVGSLSMAFFKPVTSVTPISDVVPVAFELGQNYPNPFNPQTHLQFTIAQPKADAPLAHDLQFVTLKIYDILGREVVTLVNETLKPGAYSVEWNASRFASGVYYYQLCAHQKDGGQAGNFVSVKKMVLIK